MLSVKRLYYTGGRSDRREVVRSYEELARVLHVYHTSGPAAHKGVNDVARNISRVYFWRNMWKDIKHYVCIAIDI